jgi:hypothetical protein
MRPFSRKPPVPALAPPVHRPWDPPEAEFPGIAAIATLECGRSEQAAIAITGISAYSEGFEIFVTRLLRPGAPSIDGDLAPDAPGDMPAARLPSPMGQQSFQISLQLGDGTTVIGRRLQGGAEPAGPILWPRGGGGTLHYQLLRWWAWPLPPSGPLEFICQWPAYGIARTRVGIDAQLILDAARRSIRLWPENES